MAPRLREGPQDHNMDSQRHTARLVRVPGRSAVLTMEAPRWRARPVGDRASAEGPMGAVGMGAGGEGSSPIPTHEGHYKMHLRRKQSCAALTKGSQ